MLVPEQLPRHLAAACGAQRLSSSEADPFAALLGCGWWDGLELVMRHGEHIKSVMVSHVEPLGVVPNAPPQFIANAIQWGQAL